MSTTTNWSQKLEAANKKGGIRKQTNKGMMYISTPTEIEGLINEVPKGKLTTTKIIAEKLTKKHNVDFTCPLTTGIFSSVVANKTEEDRSLGKTSNTPYWRVIKPDGKLYDKYLGQILPQKELLETEGFKFEKGKNYLKVKNFKNYLV